MKRRLLIVAAVLAAVALALTVLLTSEAALRWVFARAVARAPGELRVQELHGNLLGPIRARGLVYRDADAELHIGELALDWRPAALLRATWHIKRLELDEVQWRQRRAPASTTPAPRLALPFAVEVDAARLTHLTYTPGAGSPVTFARAELAGRWRGTRVQLAQFALETEHFSIATAGQLDLTPPYQIDVELRWSVRVPTLAPLAGHGWLRGDSRLATEQQFAPPWDAQLNASVTDLFGAMNWNATLATADLDPSAWHPGWPAVRLRARIEAQGDYRHVIARGRVGFTYTGRSFDGDFRINASDAAVTLEAFELHERDGDATMSATGTWQPGAAAPFALRGTWQALRWPLDGQPQARSPRGSFEINGGIDRYRFELDGVLESARLGRLALRSHGDGNRDGLTTAADAQWLDGRLTASGQVYWAPELRWQLQLAGRDLNPGVLYPDWPGRLALRAESHGRYGERLNAALTIEELSGTLRNKPWRLAGGITAEGDHYSLRALELRAGTSRLQAAGRIDNQWQCQWQLAAPDLADLLPQASGSIDASGGVTGARRQPRVTARVNARALAWRNDRATALNADVDLDLADHVDSHITLQADGLRARGRAIDHVELMAQGRLSEHRLRASVRLADAYARLEAAGALQTQRWHGTLLDSEVGNARAGSWRQREAAGLEIGRDTFSLAPLCLAQDTRHVCVDGAWRVSAGGHMNARVAGVPLAVFEPWIGDDARLEGRVTGQTRLVVAADGGLDGELTLAVGAGALRLGNANEAATAIGFDGMTLRARVAADRLEAAAVLALTGAGSANAELGMPFAPFKPKPAGERALHGTVRAQLDQLELFTVLMPQLLQPRGRLQLQAELGGTLDAPEVRGEARLEQGHAGVASLGITLDDVRVSARSIDARRIAIQAEARSGPGTLDVDGHVDIGADVPWRAQLQLRGQDFEAIHLPEYTLIGSPDLRLSAHPGAVELDGTVRVARALIAPRTLRAGAQRSPDVVVLGGGPEVRAEQTAVTADVRVVLGQQVRVATYNVTALVEGDVTVRDRPGQPTTASGELRVTRGTYRAYGKDLDIDRGRLTFTGGAVDDPEVDLRAVRHVENVTVGIQASGRLQNPEVSLFSDPALDQTNILSYIVFGTPAQQSGGAENAWLAQAVSALTLAGGEQLARGVGGAVGIEDVRIASDATGGTSLMLGSYLSPRLYVSYGIGLFETGNSLRLRYDLTEHWQVQTDTGTNTGADILYKIER
ncbi:MAG TPA: translocation/assembly module TamB domain-containing protein [Candidatus Methylomirabilis sp.]|nr:translocation/assembly module TamB domain-containing protein [Candidatus Methylomirabilis sp.]